MHLSRLSRCLPRASRLQRPAVTIAALSVLLFASAFLPGARRAAEAAAPPDEGEGALQTVVASPGRDVAIVFAGLARDGEPPPSRIPESPEGLRVWSDGDSVSYFMTTNLFDILSGLGGLPVRAADYKISSRLADPSGYSAVLGVPFSWWLTYLPVEVGAYEPDLVVLMVGANDAVFVAPWLYGLRAAQTMDLFADGGPVLVWVGIPSLLRPDLAANAPALNEAARAEAEARDWVVFVDTSGVTPDGADGVHFGPARARLLAEAVVQALFPGVTGRDQNGGDR